MNDPAERAHAIFELTALSEDDVVPETAAIVVARELRQIAGLFAGLLDDGAVPEDGVDYIRKIVEAAAIFSELLPAEPRKTLHFVDGEKPAYIAASELCMDVADLIDDMELQAEWRRHYDEQVKRLRFFALILKKDPDNTIHSV